MSTQFLQNSTSKNPHRATRIGEMYYTYDGNGNVTRISDKAGDGQNSSNSNSDTFNPPMDTGANTGWAGVAYGREPGGSGGGNEQATQYKWDEENRLIHARVNGNEIDFLYNAGGERTAKYGKDGEVIYYDKMFQVKTNVSPLHITKHIFLGSTRVVSKLSHELGPIDLEYEKRNAYYYHGDHLGSSNYVTDYEGNEYEHYEYTPYGEMWVEEESDSLDKINFKFTSKELDEETGLYYFGARYLDARASRWLSCDPILNEYLDGKPAGGVFNPVNLNLYQYCANSPLNYTDPTGLFSIENPYSSYMNNFLLDAWYLLANTANDAVHIALEGMGFFPVAGEFADGLNALIYAFQGEYGDAALSTAAMIPLIGDLAGKGGKVGKFFTKYGDELTQYLSKHTDDALQGIESFVRNKLGKNADEVIDAVNMASTKTPKEINIKIYNQLERQYSQNGAKSIVKSYKSSLKTLKAHQDKLPNLKYKSQVETTIKNVQKQINTLEKFMKDYGIDF